jgi:hypothetical protein
LCILSLPRFEIGWSLEKPGLIQNESTRMVVEKQNLIWQ